MNDAHSHPSRRGDTGVILVDSYFTTRFSRLNTFGTLHPIQPWTEGTQIDVSDLRIRLLENGEELTQPLQIVVTGTFFPGGLLSVGWWDRQGQTRQPDEIQFEAPLQRWLFTG